MIVSSIGEVLQIDDGSYTLYMSPVLSERSNRQSCNKAHMHVYKLVVTRFAQSTSRICELSYN